MRRFDFAFGAAFTKTARYEDRVIALKVRRSVGFVEHLGVDPLNIDLHTVGHAAVDQGLFDRLIGVFQLGVFANDGNVHLTVGVVNAVFDVEPTAKAWFRGWRNAERIQNRLIQTFVVIGQRCLIDRFQIVCCNHSLFADVTEQRDFFAFTFGDWLFRTAHQNIRRQTDRLKFLNRVLSRFCFQFTRSRQIRQQCQVHQNAFAAWFFVNELTNGFEKRQTLDVANGAADFAQHKVDFVIADADEVLDFVGDVGNDLNRLAQIVAAAFFFQNVGIDATGRDRVGGTGGNAGEPFVVPQIEVGFRTVIGHEHFAMFERRHRAGINVQIGIEFSEANRIPARLQQCTQRRRRKALA